MARQALQSANPCASVEWLSASAPVPYEEALEAMNARVEAIFAGDAPECVWLLEHPPIYTAGTSAEPQELLEPFRFPVYRTGRGGRFTYHGPGQRVAYVMLDLSARGRDVRAFVTALEDWLIATLARLGVNGERYPGQIGIFVEGAKIASIGVRVRRWVSLHGVSLNVDPDLRAFLRHRALRIAGAGDEPRRAWGRDRHGQGRCRPPRGLRRRLWWSRSRP